LKKLSVNPFDTMAQVERKKEISFMFTMIDEWKYEARCEGAERFDSTFVESLQEQFEEKGYLTEKQFAALQNIMERGGM